MEAFLAEDTVRTLILKLGKKMERYLKFLWDVELVIVNHRDDWNLSVRALNEVLTSDVSSSRWRWAIATSSLFGPLAILKKLVSLMK
jgi:hypothetical protein